MIELPIPFYGKIINPENSVECSCSFAVLGRVCCVALLKMQRQGQHKKEEHGQRDIDFILGKITSSVILGIDGY